MSILFGAFGAQPPRVATTLSILDFLFSGQAILIYILVIILGVGALVLTLALSEPKAGKKEQKITIEGTVSAEGVSGGSVKSDEMNGERFCMLSQIDRNKGKYGQKKYEQGISLEYFCES
ncbi:MAG: hypothetical protein J6L85_03025, partial [Clostridia bacterium]|nr:hypothetical protein [Clostridia bacterium]